MMVKMVKIEDVEEQVDNILRSCSHMMDQRRNHPSHGVTKASIKSQLHGASYLLKMIRVAKGEQPSVVGAVLLDDDQQVMRMTDLIQELGRMK